MIGGRLELGNLHLGVAGHWGQQYMAGRFDLNPGWGISRVFPLASDSLNPAGTGPSTVSLLKCQMAFAGALFYHARSCLHLSVDTCA